MGKLPSFTLRLSWESRSKAVSLRKGDVPATYNSEPLGWFGVLALVSEPVAPDSDNRREFGPKSEWQRAPAG